MNSQAQNKKTRRRIDELIQSTRRTPFEGMASVCRCGITSSGSWPRWVKHSSRLAYNLSGARIGVVSRRYHYQPDSARRQH
ncbi:MAG: type II toxin-antitoxin system YoeB family toxin [Rhodoferax sp.]|nr:type II toxin-antitoxin system YoeB family toxin [Pseudorhodobacter sp.]